MVCPQCSYENPEASTQCVRCTTPLPLSEQTLATGGQGWSVPAPGLSGPQTSLSRLDTGTVLGNRYEIIRMLGQGGMGAVYQAYDRELERQVGLKVIRSDMAANPEILKRFKQELILARQVTHKNVIRIFDLGQVEGLKFITMEYIDGENLQSILRREKKLPPAKAASIIAQVCRALEAAHAEGVIHRDLKPQNIMLDKGGRVLVMDFGIARSMAGGGMTQTGALIGTPDYMSPEQAKGQSLDARSDLFSVGIIFYEMLSGEVPFNADTTMAKLWKRTNEPARPVAELDKTIPQPLSDIVRKCLEIDPQKRFASASELLRAIELWQGPAAGTRVSGTAGFAWPAYTKWLAVGLGVAILGGGFWLRNKWAARPVGPHPPVILLISDFDNRTGDAVFDGTLEPIMSITLEGAPFVSSFNRGQAKKIAAGLKPGTTGLNAASAELVAVREGLNAVVTGSISQDGSGYKVYVSTVDPATGKSVISEQKSASNKQEVLSVASKLAEGIRKGLGDTTIDSQKSASETFTAASLEAAHAYALGQDFQMSAKWSDALDAYAQAVKLDPDLGRAYAGTAAIYANLGRRQEAEKYYALALKHIDRMTEREKYRTRTGYYLLMRDQFKAMEELSALVSQYPADTSGHANLALAYLYSRDPKKALEEEKRALAITPHSVLQRVNYSMYALYAGDFDTAASEAQGILQENPNFDQALRTLALAELARGHDEEARQVYTRLQTVNAYGASLAAFGLADLALYQGRLTDAATILQRAIPDDLAAKDLDSAANRTATLALIQLTLGKSQDALSSASKAAADSKEPSVLYRAAQVYIATGQEQKTQQIADALSARLETDPKMYAKLINGEAQLKKGNPRDALASFQEAQKISDSWLGHFDMGRAYLDLGDAFTEASSEFDVCARRRGEATSVFLDDVPSYHILPPVYYYQGLAREGLHSPGATESYKQFLSIKEKGAGDPLVADAQRRIAAH